MEAQSKSSDETMTRCHGVLIRLGNLPKMTSGKIQRGLARSFFLDCQFANVQPGLPGALA